MTVLVGDCVEVMAGMEPESVDAVVTDPPYGLEFMGREWDRFVKAPRRIAGTGGTEAPFAHHAVATDPRRNAAYGEWCLGWAAAALRVARPGAYLLAFGGNRTVHRLACAVEDAGWAIRDLLMWGYAQGFPKSRSSLKPAFEPIVMARKPGPLRELGIEACRIGTEVETWPASRSYAPGQIQPGGVGKTQATGPMPAGRWPANVILTDPIFDGGWEGVEGGGETTSGKMMPTDVRNRRTVFGQDAVNGYTTIETYGDSGTYSRFFLVPKAPTRERVIDGERSPHPTQKPEALIRHLVRLVNVPAGGVVLDPFLGSGTLGVVCDGLGVKWVGIEREPEYAEWAERRVAAARPGWEAVG